MMFRLGFDETALEYLKANWIPISKNGTFAEHFVEDKNTSYCHGWGAGPVVLLPQFVLGVRPVSPGWKQIIIDPHPGKLKWAKGSIPTINGEITVEWEKSRSGLKILAKVPDGVEIVKEPLA